MTHWNHRVVHTHHRDFDTDTYQIHEVYYREDGTIEAWTENAVQPRGESFEELREDLNHFLRALEQPLLHKVTVGETERLLRNPAATDDTADSPRRDDPTA